MNVEHIIYSRLNNLVPVKETAQLVEGTISKYEKIKNNITNDKLQLAWIKYTNEINIQKNNRPRTIDFFVNQILKIQNPYNAERYIIFCPITKDWLSNSQDFLKNAGLSAYYDEIFDKSNVFQGIFTTDTVGENKQNGGSVPNLLTLLLTEFERMKSG